MKSIILNSSQKSVVSKSIDLYNRLSRGDLYKMFDYLPLERPIPDAVVSSIISSLKSYISNRQLPKLEGKDNYSSSDFQGLTSALDIFSRVAIGQWREFERAVIVLDEHLVIPHSVLESVGRTISLYTYSGVDGWSSNLGIHNQLVDDSARIAFDIHQVMRNYISWEGVYSSGKMVRGGQRVYSCTFGVSFDEPYATSKEPLPILVDADS